MDFYCKVKTKQNGPLLLEQVLPLTAFEDWTRENSAYIRNGFAFFPSSGANGTAYFLIVDLSHPSRKALIREEDHQIIFSGIPSKFLPL